jgi:hypothetical protein
VAGFQLVQGGLKELATVVKTQVALPQIVLMTAKELMFRYVTNGVKS